MNPATIRTVQDQLKRLGWPLTPDGKLGVVTRRAVKDFQRGYARGVSLPVTGNPGLITRKAIAQSVKDGKISEHFLWADFKSNGNGWVRANRGFVKSLEKYRARFGPTTLLSAYRDPAHNAYVGGAQYSQHTDIDVHGEVFLGGNATDFANPKARLSEVKALGEFSGIGITASTGLVRHVDTRHKGGYNPAGSTPANPAVWYYT